MAQRNPRRNQRKIRHCFSLSLSPSHVGRTGRTGVSVRNKNQPDGGGKVGREGERQKQVRMDGYSLNGEHRCCVKVCSPANMCFPLPPRIEKIQNWHSFC